MLWNVCKYPTGADVLYMFECSPQEGHALNSIEETLWVECKTNLVGFFGVGYVSRAGELGFFLLNSKSRCFAIWHVPGCLFGIHVILSCKYIPPRGLFETLESPIFF